MNGFALGLGLKRRLRATWKWASYQRITITLSISLSFQTMGIYVTLSHVLFFNSSYETKFGLFLLLQMTTL